MAHLQVKDIEDSLYEALRSLAKRENRSISQEVITILKKYLSNPSFVDRSITGEFLELSGSWEDKRSAAEIINDILKHRYNTSRFKNGIFDLY
jgi:plasmid stability protein